MGARCIRNIGRDHWARSWSFHRKGDGRATRLHQTSGRLTADSVHPFVSPPRKPHFRAIVEPLRAGLLLCRVNEALKPRAPIPTPLSECATLLRACPGGAAYHITRLYARRPVGDGALFLESFGATHNTVSPARVCFPRPPFVMPSCRPTSCSGNLGTSPHLEGGGDPSGGGQPPPAKVESPAACGVVRRSQRHTPHGPGW